MYKTLLKQMYVVIMNKSIAFIYLNVNWGIIFYYQFQNIIITKEEKTV